MRRWINEARNATRRVSSDEGGFTLVEVLASITILVVAVLAIAGVAAQSMRSTRLARDRQLATQAATAAVETARAASYANLAMEATCADAVAEDDVVGSCPGTPTLDGEELILSTDPDAIDFKVVEGRFTVRTFVTWFDDVTAAGVRDAKRVTVSVTWDEVGGPDDRELTQSTIISEAHRGLPVPEFIIRPTSRDAVVETGDPICLSQTLTNIGAADTYDFLASKPDGTVNPQGGQHFKVGSNGNWLVYGWLGKSDRVPTNPLQAWDGDGDGEVDLDGSGNPIPNPKYDGATPDDWHTFMRDVTGDLIPDSNPDLRVPRNASRTVVTCYYPKSGSEGDPDFTITVRSGFDSNVTVELAHHLDTTDLILNLYLRDPQSLTTDLSEDPCADSEWEPSGSGRQEPFELEDGDAPFCTSLRNFDTDHDALPGLLLPRSTTPPSAKFDYQFQDGATIGGSGTLRVWTSHPDAVSGTASNDRTIVVDVVLKRVNTADAARNATFHTARLSYPHLSGTTWEAHTIDLSAIADTAFQSSEFLRLELSCPNTSARDCLIAYDTASSATPPADANLVVSSP